MSAHNLYEDGEAKHLGPRKDWKVFPAARPEPPPSRLPRIFVRIAVFYALGALAAMLACLILERI